VPDIVASQLVTLPSIRYEDSPKKGSSRELQKEFETTFTVEIVGSSILNDISHPRFLCRTFQRFGSTILIFSFGALKPEKGLVCRLSAGRVVSQNFMA
jgi:hypothetical protein